MYARYFLRHACIHVLPYISLVIWDKEPVQFKNSSNFVHGLLVTCFLMQLLLLTINSLPHLIRYSWSTIKLIHPTCFSPQVNYVMNTLLSFNMVIAFLVAVILDNTVPGSCQERGVYVWSEAEAARKEPAVSRDYELPIKVGLWCECHCLMKPTNGQFQFNSFSRHHKHIMFLKAKRKQMIGQGTVLYNHPCILMSGLLSGNWEYAHDDMHVHWRSVFHTVIYDWSL